MMKSILFLSFFLLANLSVAQEQVIEVSSGEQEVVAQELEKEAAKPEHDKKTKRLLKKVAQALKSSAKKIEIEVKSLDDCRGDCSGKKKEQVVLTNIGRKLGRGSAWLTTATTKPFMQASGFLTGLLQKKDKNQDIIALYKFFLNHQAEFDNLYLEAGGPEELVELMLAQIEVIMEKKSRIILADSLKALGLNKEVPEDLSNFELTEEEIASLDLSKLNADLINKHPEYAELRPFLGDMKQEELMDIITLGYFDRAISFENFKEALPKVREGVTTIMGQIIAPQVALNVVSNTLAGLYAIPVMGANVGTGISTYICLSPETRDRFESDEDLRSFCSYVVNRSAYQLVKSRAKGYVAGKTLRQKLEEKAQKRKQRRAERKEKKISKNSQLG